MKWAGLGEVTVNITSLAVQKELGQRSRLDGTGMVNGAKKFLAQPDAERQFGKADVWVRLRMFDQLTRAFGDDFYASLAQKDRVEAQMGLTRSLGTDAAMQRFATLAAQTAQRDLRPFFAAWGFPLTADTGKVMAALPALRNRIWENLDSTKPVVERKVTYSPPVVSVKMAGAATLEQRSPGNTLKPVVSATGGTKGVASVTATRIGTGTGQFTQRFVAPDGTPNVIFAPVDVVHGTDIAIRGLDNVDLVVFALDAVSGRIHAVLNSTNQSHVYFKNEEYAAVRYTNAAGTVLADEKMTGTGRGDALVKALDGIPFQNGGVLELRHREPSRMFRWDAGKAAPANTATTQRYRVQGGRLIPTG